jgi:hypothetical protein
VAELARMRADAPERPFHHVLKLETSRASAAALLPEAVQAVAGLSFDEVVIDLPWDDGLERAEAVIRACTNALDRRSPE